MYTPTKEELEELGFTIYFEQGVSRRFIGPFTLECDLPFWYVYACGDSTEIHPTTKADILTLIRLFSNS